MVVVGPDDERSGSSFNKRVFNIALMADLTWHASLDDKQNDGSAVSETRDKGVRFRALDDLCDARYLRLAWIDEGITVDQTAGLTPSSNETTDIDERAQTRRNRRRTNANSGKAALFRIWADAKPSGRTK